MSMRIEVAASRALEQSPDASVADIARKASCSFATAWQAAQDYNLLRAT